MMLYARDLTVHYDRAIVLNKVSIEVNEGELVSVVGPNGAGKSTLLRAMAGLIKWEMDTLKGTTLGKITLDGSIRFSKNELIHKQAHEIAKMGVVICPERGRPFREMTVCDNLKAGGYLIKDKRDFDNRLSRVYDLFPILETRANQISGTLSGGERTMLSIARALMTRVEILLIDEPSVGLAPKVKEDLFERIRNVHEMGITILLIEQDVSFAFALSSRNYVMSKGKIIAEGTAKALMEDELVRKTYLGL